MKLSKTEINNVRCILTIINAVLILTYGISFAWIGLFVAAFGIIKDMITGMNTNELVMHGSNVIMYTAIIIRGH